MQSASAGPGELLLRSRTTSSTAASAVKAVARSQTSPVSVGSAKDQAIIHCVCSHGHDRLFSEYMGKLSVRHGIAVRTRDHLDRKSIILN